MLCAHLGREELKYVLEQGKIFGRKLLEKINTFLCQYSSPVKVYEITTVRSRIFYYAYAS
jgi:hypothetical protein